MRPWNRIVAYSAVNDIGQVSHEQTQTQNRKHQDVSLDEVCQIAPKLFRRWELIFSDAGNRFLS